MPGVQYARFPDTRGRIAHPAPEPSLRAISRTLVPRCLLGRCSIGHSERGSGRESRFICDTRGRSAYPAPGSSCHAIPRITVLVECSEQGSGRISRFVCEYRGSRRSGLSGQSRSHARTGRVHSVQSHSQARTAKSSVARPRHAPGTPCVTRPPAVPDPPVNRCYRSRCPPAPVATRGSVARP